MTDKELKATEATKDNILGQLTALVQKHGILAWVAVFELIDAAGPGLCACGRLPSESRRRPDGTLALRCEPCNADWYPASDAQALRITDALTGKPINPCLISREEAEATAK